MPVLRRLDRFTVVVFSAALMCMVQASKAADDELIVADQKGLQRAVLQAAKADQNLPYHVHWAEFEAAAPLLQALSAGAVDTGVAGDGPFLFAWGSGLPVKAAYWFPPRGGGHTTGVVVAASSKIHGVADLSGKRIATGRGSIGHLLLLRLIQTGEIPAPAPKLVFLPPAQAKAALDSGSIDAWSTWEPYISLETVQSHGRVVVDAARILPNNGFLVTTDASLAHKRALLADFYQRVRSAYAWGATHQSEYAAILGRQTGLPPDVAKAVSAEMIGAPAPVTEDVIRSEQPTLDAYESAGLIKGSNSLDAAFVTGFAKP